MSSPTIGKHGAFPRATPFIRNGRGLDRVRRKLLPLWACGGTSSLLCTRRAGHLIRQPGMAHGSRCSKSRRRRPGLLEADPTTSGGRERESPEPLYSSSACFSWVTHRVSVLGGALSLGFCCSPPTACQRTLFPRRRRCTQTGCGGRAKHQAQPRFPPPPRVSMGSKRLGDIRRHNPRILHVPRA